MSTAEQLINVKYVWVWLELGRGSKEWSVKDVGKVKTYRNILCACLPWGVLFSNIPQGHSRYGICRRRFGVDLDFPKDGMLSRVDDVPDIPEGFLSHQ
jgi:hypothetical protein